MPKRTVEERFWSKVEKTETCWLWTGFIEPKGYGQFENKGQCKAHRYAYELLVGPIPEGKQLDHLCRVRHCVNPAHLEPVTLQENIRRGRAGRYQAEKTHCKRGHPFDEANTYWWGGWRHCKACQREREQRRRST